MNRKDLSNIGNDIKEMIKSGVNSGDYQKISKEVGNTVNSALEVAFEEVRKALSSIQMDNNQSKNNVAPLQKQTMKPPVIKKQPPKGIYFPHSPVGKVAGVLLTVFGSIGIGLIGTAILILGTLGISPQILIGLLVLLGTCVALEIKGANIRNRIKRYKRYLSLFYGRNSCPMDELSSYCNVTERFLIKDLKKMITIGMFPQAHINQEKTLLILNRERYDEYLKEQMIVKEQLLKERKKIEDNKKPKRINSIGKFEINTVIEEGKMYIQQINDSKAAISDGEVYNKVHRMEEIIGKIMEYIESHPAQLPDVRRFMQYYLPTTIKLLHAYEEFERQPIQGENIKTAKQEIKDALDTINLAFENLFDSLFADASMDISTDISVLHTILAQEGLTEQDFTTAKTEGDKNNDIRN